MKFVGLVDNKDIIVPKELYDLVLQLGRKLAGFRGTFPDSETEIYQTLFAFKVQFEFYYRKNFEKWCELDKEQFKKEAYKEYGLRLY